MPYETLLYDIYPNESPQPSHLPIPISSPASNVISNATLRHLPKRAWILPGSSMSGCLPSTCKCKTFLVLRPITMSPLRFPVSSSGPPPTPFLRPSQSLLTINLHHHHFLPLFLGSPRRFPRIPKYHICTTQPHHRCIRALMRQLALTYRDFGAKFRLCFNSQLVLPE